MKKNNKKAVKSIEEILEILERVFLSRTHLSLGQDFDEIVKQSWSLIQNINPHTYDLAIRPKDPNNQFYFSPKSHISITTESETIKFDVNLKKLNHRNLIIVEIPKILELIDTRQAKRFHYEHLEIPLVYRNLSIKSYRKRNQLLRAMLEDISINGISYKVPHSEDLEFQYGDKITILSLNEYSLPLSFQGKIVYLQDFKKNEYSNIYTKIGVKFDKQIEIEKIIRYLDSQKYFIKKAV